MHKRESIRQDHNHTSIHLILILILILLNRFLAFRMEKRQKLIAPAERHHIPHEILENILCRLPAKSLLRFKAVSKSWKSIISDDPGFSDVHLRQSKISASSSNKNLMFWIETYPYRNKTNLITLQDFESMKSRKPKQIEFPMEQGLHLEVLCHCDGLALRRTRKAKDKTYVLCNPSSRTWVKFRCPYRIYHRRYSRTAYGMCYDPLLKDYKVVIIYKKHYTVFHCRTKVWSKIKLDTVNGFSSLDEVNMGQGVSFDGGDLYFLAEIERRGNRRVEIVCFDSTCDRLNKLPYPGLAREVYNQLEMTCLGGYLYLFSKNVCQMIKVTSSSSSSSPSQEKVAWMEFNGQPPFSGNSTVALCSIDQVATRVNVRSFTTTIGHGQIPYLENLFFSSVIN